MRCCSARLGESEPLILQGRLAHRPHRSASGRHPPLSDLIRPTRYLAEAQFGKQHLETKTKKNQTERGNGRTLGTTVHPDSGTSSRDVTPTRTENRIVSTPFPELIMCLFTGNSSA